MPVYFYNKKEKKVSYDLTFNQFFESTGADKFRQIEKHFLETRGEKIIGFFAYLPFGALNNFNLNKFKSYLIMTEDFPLDSKDLDERYRVTKDQYITATQQSYNNFDNGNTSKADSDKYKFRSKTLFGSISDKYELPNPFGITFESPIGAPSISTPGTGAPGTGWWLPKDFLSKNTPEISAQGTNLLSTDGFRYFEEQYADQCGQHAINNILQEQKIITDTSKKKSIFGLGDPKDKNVKLNMVDYCDILTKDQKEKYGTKEPVCSNSYDNVDMIGLIILLEKYLGYTVYQEDTQVGDRLPDFIKINLQRPRCLGVLLYVNNDKNDRGHYVVVAKHYEEDKYTYIDSNGDDKDTDKIKLFSGIDDLIGYLKNDLPAKLNKSIKAAVAIIQNANSYISNASIANELKSNVPDYFKIEIDVAKQLKNKYKTLTNLFSTLNDGEKIKDFKKSFHENVSKAIIDCLDRDGTLLYGLNYTDFTGFIELVNKLNEEHFIKKQQTSSLSVVSPTQVNLIEGKKSSAIANTLKPNKPNPPLSPKPQKKETAKSVIVNPPEIATHFSTIEDQVRLYMDDNNSGFGYISELLPRIFENNFPGKPANGTTVTVDKDKIFKLRKTFKNAIVTLLEDDTLNGGGSTHKLKIKKRKTHRKKLLRHKSRNTINRLKLVRQ
jgi:hypothetical protein